MSTPSMVLLCAGAACSLAGVWSLAGLSERSSLRATQRALAAGALGLAVLAVVYQLTPAPLRGELSLPALFGAASVLALVAGAAKLDSALAEKDGPRAVRRAAGLIGGSFLGIAAVAAASLELVSTSLSHARFAWAFMLPVVAAVFVVFAQRSRLAGAGALALGPRGLLAFVVGLVLLGAARYSVKPPHAPATPRAPTVLGLVAMPSPEPLVSVTPPEPSVSVTPPEPSAASSAPHASAAAAPSLAPPLAPGAPGELQIEAIVSKGLLEADARGGVTRRLDRLQACLSDPKHQQSGVLTLRIGIDASGSVHFARPTGGELLGTPLATCLLPAFYKMGFAAPGSANAYVEITLRAPTR